MEHGNVHMIENEEEFDAIIFTAENKLVAVDFYADWCGPCKMISPYFVQLSHQFPEVVFLKVNVDQQRSIAQRYGVRAMPTFLFFKNGKQVHEFKGANSQNLLAAIQQHSGSSGSPGFAAPPAQPEPSPPQYTNFPQKTYVYFDVAKLDTVLDKLLSFNPKYETEGPKEHALTGSEVSALKKTINTLKNTGMYHATSFSAEEIAVINKVISWPQKDRFPALDILRMFVMHPEGAKAISNSGVAGKIINYLKEKDAPFASHLMCLRFLCNSFRWLYLRNVLLPVLGSVFFVIHEHQKSDKKDIRVAIATILLNFSIFYTNDEEAQGKSAIQLQQCAHAAISAAKNEQDEETLYRLLCAFGTAGCDKSVKSVIESNKASIEAIQHASTKVQEVKKELIMLCEGKVPALALRRPPSQQPTPTQQPPAPTPSMPGFGGMGGSPGMGGMGGLTPDMMQKIASSPELMQAIQKPGLMAKLQQMMSDPSQMMQFQNDPEVMDLMLKLSAIMK